MARRENDYLIDRDMQKNVNYTGIQGIGRQDQAVVECMGEIVDRTLEHLAPSGPHDRTDPQTPAGGESGAELANVAGRRSRPRVDNPVQILPVARRG